MNKDVSGCMAVDVEVVLWMYGVLKKRFRRLYVSRDSVCCTRVDKKRE